MSYECGARPASMPPPSFRYSPRIYTVAGCTAVARPAPKKTTALVSAVAANDSVAHQRVRDVTSPMPNTVALHRTLNSSAVQETRRGALSAGFDGRRGGADDS